MGKWTHLIGEYPERKLALKDLKDKCEAMSMDELEREVAQHHKRLKELKSEKSLVEQQYVAASEALVERWQEDGTQSIKREHLGLLVRNDDVRARIIDMDEFKAWAKENQLADLVQETVNSNTLSSTVKTLLGEGTEIPECISLFIQSRVNVTQPKGAKV
tara:strand:+ start:20367 stop:20846 length:480 start_codon:yes stop_codon:yes gene_type:complete